MPEGYIEGRGQSADLDSLSLLGSKGEMSRISWVHFLLVNLKHIKVGIRVWGGRSSHLGGQLFRFLEAFQKGIMGEDSLVPYLAVLFVSVL